VSACLSACLSSDGIGAVRLAPPHNDKKGFISTAPTKDCRHKGKYGFMQIKVHAVKTRRSETRSASRVSASRRCYGANYRQRLL